jgi:thiamine-monophosphate kinase
MRRHVSEVYHRAAHGAGDAGDELDLRHNELAELIDVGRLAAHDDVIGASNAFGLGDAVEFGDGGSHCCGLSHLGLDEDVGVNHGHSLHELAAREKVALKGDRTPEGSMAEIKDVGEFNLITRLARAVGVPAPPEGPGDDAALVTVATGRLVATTDLLIEGTHFRRDWSSAYDIGRKVAAQNLADVAAMGARPSALLLGLGAPGEFPLDDFDAIAAGVRDECAAAGAALIGGDLVRAPQLVLSGTALGVVEAFGPVLRSGARPGDVFGVIGRLGWAAAGLRLLLAGETEGPLIDAHRRPQPPYAAGVELAAAGATSMCDVSDGLVGDAGHLAVASGVTIDLELAALRALGAPGVTDQELLTGGEDHALAFTAPVEAALPEGAVIVGRVVAGEPVVLVDGQPTTQTAFAHFVTD